MRLHDVQVTLSAADAANRYQVHHQQLAQAVQAQEALILTARAEQKKTQTQAAEQEQKSKEASENESHGRKWNKGFREDSREKKQDQDKDSIRGKPDAGPGREHIIDIRA
jgi:hypothetical protein